MLTFRKRKKRDPRSVCNSRVDKDYVLTDPSGDNNGLMDSRDTIASHPEV